MDTVSVSDALCTDDELDSRSHNTPMAHLNRGEMRRMSAWRLPPIERHYFIGQLRAAHGTDRLSRGRLASEFDDPVPHAGLVIPARFRLRREYLAGRASSP
jgi:hypothetical protein